MKTIQLTYLLIFFVTTAIAQHPLSGEVDKLFDQWNRTDSPGCAIAVVKDGKVVFQKGYGMSSLEHGLAIQPNSVFYIGSVSKQFVTFCMLLLEEQGRLNLDENIRIYFPEMPDYGHPITVRNLIHHTSGIRDYLTLWRLQGRSYLDDMDPEVVYDLICRQQELNFEPGTKYLYSNSCYFMMALLVERLTGQTIQEFAKEHIFDPLGMSSTQFYDDNRKFVKNRVFGYGGNMENGFSNMYMRFDLVGSGGIYSSVEDLYKWDQNFYQNILGKGGQAIIEKMQTNGRFKDGSDAGYAFALKNDVYRGLKTVGHTGALGGYRANYIRFPEKSFSVIILSNWAGFNPLARSLEVADIFLKDEFSEEKPVSSSPNQPEMDQKKKRSNISVNSQKFAGRFYSPELDVFYQFGVDQAGQLVFQNEGRNVPLEVIDPFTFEVLGMTVRFEENLQTFRLDAGRVQNLLFERAD